MNEQLDHTEAQQAYAEALELANEVMLGDFATNPDYWIGRMHGLIFQHGESIPTADLLDVFIPLADAMSAQKKTDAPSVLPIQWPGTYPNTTSPWITCTDDKTTVGTLA